MRGNLCRISQIVLGSGWVLVLLAFASARNDKSMEQDHSFVRVSSRNPRYFELTNGEPFVPIGLNLIHPRQDYREFGPDSRAASAGEEDREGAAGLSEMERWMDRFCHNSGNFMRIWLSAPFWDVEREKSGHYDERRARRLERLLALARERKIRVKLTLEHFRTIEGPTRQAWAYRPLHHLSQGGPASSIADFFDGQASRDQFVGKLRWYADRFGEDPSVFGWELWNEINAVAGGGHLAWTEIMLRHLHILFPRNLAMQSLGSFDSAEVRQLYRQMSLLAGNDVAQVHRYLDLGAELEICRGPVDVLAADAVSEILAFQPGRPVLLAESGAVEPNHSGPSKLYALDRQGTLLHDILFAPFFAGAAGPGHCWHWDVYVDANNLWYHFGRFAEAIRDVNPVAEGFTPMRIGHDRLRVYALRGQTTTLLWCRDSRADWRSELLEGKPPDTLRGVRLDISPLQWQKPPHKLSAYDPWADRWTEAHWTGQELELPPFSRSLVIRLK